MATAVIRIPKIGVSMTEGILSQWMVEDGDHVEAGKPLYALELDKSTNEIDAPISGKIEILGVVGETFMVGDLIGRIHSD